MSELFGPWGSPGYALLDAACQRATNLHHRYERTGHLPDLEQAIIGFRVVLDLAHNIDVRGAATNGLGTALWSRYERFGSATDLGDAIDSFREALAMYPDGETPLTMVFRANLSGVLRLRWRRSRSDDDLAESMTMIQDAVAATPRTHSRRSTRLNSLADVLLAQYLLRADSAALDKAIEVWRLVLDGAQQDGEALTWRSNLAEALRLRSRVIGDRDRTVLDEAVEHARAALAGTRTDDPLRPRFESNLALVLLDRFRSRGRPRDLAAAAVHSNAAVGATWANDAHRAQRLCILSAIRRMELTHVSGLQTLDPQRHAEVRDAARGNRPTRSMGWRRRRAWRRGTQRAALRRALRAADDATAALPEGHMLLASSLVMQGSAFAFKAVLDKDSKAFRASIDCYRRVALDTVAPAWERVSAAFRWAIIELARNDGKDWSSGMEAFELAVNLLPYTAPRQTTYADRARQLADCAGLPRDAAACAIHEGDPHHAVRLLEHGRGVLLGQALDARTDLTDLHQRDAGMARRFEELRAALDTPDSVDVAADPGAVLGGLSHLALPVEQRHALAKEWERLLDSIRHLPGFERFLLPPRIDELCSAASEHGPVVIVNISGLRCDALLLTEGKVELVPLPLLTQAGLIQRVDEFRSALGKAQHSQLPAQARQSARQQIDETLEWLWDTVTEPVLDALGLLRPPRTALGSGETLPRLWWVPTGPLSALPLHAAGRRDSPGSCVLDTVISSYAPTLRSLAAAWQANSRDSVRPSDPPAPLVIPVPAAPGVPDLPRVRDETAALTSRLPHCRVLAGHQAVRATVLDALPRHRWAHFACHAVSAAESSTIGYLVLHDHAVAPLTVSDIARLRLADAEIAYLSACATSVSVEHLDDEALHITGACHMAGFRHVIGTLWAIRDELAPAVADDFYAVLTSAGADTSESALALHTAVGSLRTVYPDSPELWAPHVHVGP